MISIIAVTGGIGSGKTVLTHLFAAQNIPTLDLDHVGKDLLKYNHHVKKDLCHAFGNQILHTDQSINRVALAALAFQNKASTNLLNNIMHPIIQQHETKWRMQQHAPFAIVEASVLIESNQCTRMDAIIVVLAHTDIRRKRVLERGKQTKEMFDAIAARQCNDQQRRKAADYIIENNHTLQTLAEQQQLLYKKLLNIF